MRWRGALALAFGVWLLCPLKRPMSVERPNPF